MPSILDDLRNSVAGVIGEPVASRPSQATRKARTAANAVKRLRRKNLLNQAKMLKEKARDSQAKGEAATTEKAASKHFADAERFATQAAEKEAEGYKIRLRRPVRR